MQFVCVIASHLSSIERAKWLNQCLISTIEGLKADRIIISCSGDIEPIIPNDHKIYSLRQTEKKLQFEHIESIVPLINDDDIVIFMDDDDLFLPESRSIIEDLFAQGYKCSEGLAYCTYSESIGNADNFGWEDVKTKDLSKLNLDSGYDFPGTFCTGKHLKEYFESEKRIASWERSKELDEYGKGEEDCVFTQCYIQKLDGFIKSTKPWIFHRQHFLKRDYGVN